MLYKLHLFQRIWRKTRLVRLLPYLSLLVWILPLFLFTSGHNSLMAHDEALYASRARLMFDSGNWITPWEKAHHKTPGPYWIIASFYKLFGMSDTSARIPSMIASIFSLWLVYEIGKSMLGKKLGWLAAAILSVEFLWLQYSRLSTPDVPMVLLVLLAILSLIKAESSHKYRYFWSFLAGLSLGLGFLVRSFMIFLPIIALFPYLIWEHRRHHHLTNPILYLGFFVGLIPTCVWLWLSWLHYGNRSFEELLKFVVQLSSENNYKNDRLFYFWNILLKAFPWAFFGFLGLFLTVRRPIPRYQLILVGFPIVLFCEISLFSTRLPHYSLCLYPFIALFASVGLNWLGSIYQTEIPLQLPIEKGKENIILSLFAKKNLPRNLSYSFGGFGVILVIVSISVLSWGGSDIRKYATIGLAMGLGWLILPVVWISRYHFGKKFLTARYWIAGWLIPCWLALATTGSIGLLSDYNPVLRSFLQQSAIAPILQFYPTYYVQVDPKTQVLLNFYLSIHPQQVASISQIPALSYAWINTDQSPKLSRPHRIIGTVKEYQLIQVLP